VADDRSVTRAAEPKQEESLEEIDNPIERLKLLSGNDEEIAKYLDAIEVTSPREREMLQEIARTRPLARPDLFPQAHRNAVEALESLARHGYKGTGAGKSMGPLRVAIRWLVQLVARYLVISHIRNVANQMRNLYTLREIQAVPGSEERYLLRRARWDAKRAVEALKARELAVPAFLIGGAALPLLAALGRVTGLLESPIWAGVLGLGGMLVSLAASWVILRGAALASRRIRLATSAPMQTLWSTIGWCGKPPKDSTRTFVIVSICLTVGAWIIVPILVAIALANYPAAARRAGATPGGQAQLGHPRRSTRHRGRRAPGRRRGARRRRRRPRRRGRGPLRGRSRRPGRSASRAAARGRRLARARRGTRS
jgi:hypothetical protein